MTTDKQCETCSDSKCGAQEKRPGEQEKDFRDRQALSSRMCKIKHKIMVLSGKGGVGKSTVAVNLAAALAMAGKQVGLLDIDIHGPSIPKLLSIEGIPISGDGKTMHPVRLDYDPGSLSVMSIGLMLRGRDDAVIWRGPMKYGVIKQFLKDVDWGELDYLVVDSPPGTGDEPLSIAQLIENADGAVIVTTPQELAVQDVRRCIVFCREVNLSVIGVIENMSGFTCPKCGEQIHIFGTAGGRTMSQDMDIPYLAAIPIIPDIVSSGDRGKPIVQTDHHSEAARAINRVVRRLLEPELASDETDRVLANDGQAMKVAIPVTQGCLSSHFGHCEEFILFEVDSDGKTIRSQQTLKPPDHEPGVFPRWLHEQGATVIIAGGMGSRAQSLFAQNNIRVVVGATATQPEGLIRAFLDGSLATGANVCDH